MKINEVLLQTQDLSPMKSLVQIDGCFVTRALRFNRYLPKDEFKAEKNLKKEDMRCIITMCQASDDETLKGSISSESGEVLLGSRQGDVRIEAGRAEETLETGRKSSSRGLLGKTTSVHRYEHDISEAVGSNIDGRTVKVVSSSGDVLVKGSSVVGDEALTIYGKNDVSVVSDVNTHYQDELSMSKKSGLLGSGFGFTIGSKKEQIEQDRRQQSAVRSQVGSLSGNTAKGSIALMLYTVPNKT